MNKRTAEYFRLQAEPKPERNREIIRDVLTGVALRVLSEKHCVTTERIRQIVFRGCSVAHKKKLEQRKRYDTAIDNVVFVKSIRALRKDADYWLYCLGMKK